MLAINATKLHSAWLMDYTLDDRGGEPHLRERRLPNWCVKLAKEWRGDEPESYFVRL